MSGTELYFLIPCLMGVDFTIFRLKHSHLVGVGSASLSSISVAGGTGEVHVIPLASVFI